MWKIVNTQDKHRVFFKDNDMAGICIDCNTFGNNVGRMLYSEDEIRLPKLNDILVRKVINPKAASIIKEVLEQLANV